MQAETAAPENTKDSVKFVQRVMAKREKTGFFTHMKNRKTDWVFFGVLVLAFVALEFIANPHRREISREEMESLLYEFKRKNSIPSWAVPFIGVAFPLLFVLAAFQWPRGLLGPIEQRELHDLIYALLINVAITATFTSALKESVGRPRPNFLHRCFPTMDTTQIIEYLEENDYQLDIQHDCKASSGTLEEGLKSFPSGHTSWATCSLAFVTFLMLGKLRPFDGRGEVWRLVVSIIPICGAVAVGITRINDYWHHWTDVVAGFGIGFMVAAAIYTMYYPWPFARQGTETPLYKEADILATNTSTDSGENSNDPLYGETRPGAGPIPPAPRAEV